MFFDGLVLLVLVLKDKVYSIQRTMPQSATWTCPYLFTDFAYDSIWGPSTLCHFLQTYGSARTAGTIIEFCFWGSNRDAADSATDMAVVVVHPGAGR